ncbi:MAG: lamin tail domain-containing protein [Verrucomicrobiaceae bacterium]|nr:MAG: lamin tail domain-containing protein [Verrucomicrobiaceae bacterium]
MLSRTLLNENSPTNPRPGQGAQNSDPRVGSVLISEIMHAPAGGNAALEFVEIRNSGTTTEPLNHWTIRGEIDFDFTEASSLPPGGVLVVVPFSPADTGKTSAFRNAYGIPSSVTLAGPWAAGERLASSGTITLYRAQASPPNELGYYPQTVEDKVAYSSVPPWATANLGRSLSRRGTSGPSDTASSWKADAPSPGFSELTPQLWRQYYFPSEEEGSGDGEDYDNDGLTNAVEYALGSSPRQTDSVDVRPVLTQPGAGGSEPYKFTFTKPLDRAGVIYQVQQSADLVNWTNVPDQAISTGPDTETRQASVTKSPETPKLFFRLQVTFAP